MKVRSMQKLVFQVEPEARRPVDNFIETFTCPRSPCTTAVRRNKKKKK
jgi:hypothetical protein